MEGLFEDTAEEAAEEDGSKGDLLVGEAGVKLLSADVPDSLIRLMDSDDALLFRGD